MRVSIPDTKTTIDKGPDIFVSIGSSLVLTCRVYTAGISLNYLIWRRGDKVMMMMMMMMMMTMMTFFICRLPDSSEARTPPWSWRRTARAGSSAPLTWGPLRQGWRDWIFMAFVYLEPGTNYNFINFVWSMVFKGKFISKSLQTFPLCVRLYRVSLKKTGISVSESF